MPGNLPVTRGLEIKIFWGLTTENQALTVLHANNVSGATVNDALATTIGSTLTAAFTSSGLAAQIVPTLGMNSVIIRDMGAATNPEFQGAASVRGTATNATPLPANVSLCVTGRTGLRGKSFNSRTYLWGFSVAAVGTTGGISAATSTAAASFMNTVRTNLTALPNSMQLSVLSRFTTPPGATSAIERNPPILTQITTYVVRDGIWDSQRRRAVPGI